MEMVQDPEPGWSSFLGMEWCTEVGYDLRCRKERSPVVQRLESVSWDPSLPVLLGWLEIPLIPS